MLVRLEGPVKRPTNQRSLEALGLHGAPARSAGLRLDGFDRSVRKREFAFLVLRCVFARVASLDSFLFSGWWL